MIKENDLDFTGQRVLVTGAASGIGLAIAKLFSAHGGELILADLNINLLKQQEWKKGSRISLHQYDQSDSFSIEKLAKTIGSVDIFCNNAGMIHTGPLIEQSTKIIQEIITIDLIGPILLARHIGESMVIRGSVWVLVPSDLDADAPENELCKVWPSPSYSRKNEQTSFSNTSSTRSPLDVRAKSG